MSLLCCDQHTRYTAGCEACNQRARRYVNRRRLAILNGQSFSGPTAVCGQWLRELRAFGYSKSFLAAEIGCSETSIYKISGDIRGFVTLGMFHRIEATYRKLRDYPGSDRRAARYAQARGWTPPALPVAPEPVDENDVDMVAVDRAVNGDPVPLTRAEKALAWEQLEAQGVSSREIAARLHTSARAVRRWRNGQTRRPNPPQKIA